MKHFEALLSITVGDRAISPVRLHKRLEKTLKNFRMSKEARKCMHTRACSVLPSVKNTDRPAIRNGHGIKSP